MTYRDQYETYREVGQQLNSKLLDAYSEQELILNSAESLGIDHDGTHIFYDVESDMAVHYEFMLYEYRRDGLTAAEHYHKEGHWDTETERTVLEATIDADTSLFEIDAVDATDDRIVVTDILNDCEEVSIVDINLSQTAEPGVLLFFRPVRYEEFTITSGVSFPFPGDHKDRLQTEYENRVNPADPQSTSLQRFVTFYDLYCDYGIHMQYE
jgi:hypothetical protein